MNKLLKQVLLFTILVIGAFFLYQKVNVIDIGTDLNVQKPVSTMVNTETDNADNDKIKINEKPYNFDGSLITDTRKEVIAFQSAKSSKDAMLIIEQLLNNGKDGLAVALMETLHGRCGYIDGWEAPFEKTAWAYEKVMDYCRSYNPSLYKDWKDKDIEEKLQNLDFSPLIADNQRVDIDELTDEFLSIATKSTFDGDSIDLVVFRTLNYFNHQLGIPLSLGQTDEINPHDVQRVQETAWTIYQCERFGGCGADEINSWEICAITNVCSPGWSVMDFYQRILSPVNFESVLKIVSTFHQYEHQNP